MTAIAEGIEAKNGNGRPGSEITRAGQVIAQTVRNAGRESRAKFAFDLDGVFFDGTALHSDVPIPLHTETVPALVGLIDAVPGIKVGLVTSRGAHHAGWFEEQGVPVDGPSVFSSGEHTIINGIEKHWGHPDLPEFLTVVRTRMENSPFYVPSWLLAEHSPYDTANNPTVAPGSRQWWTDTSHSYWFGDQVDSEDLTELGEPNRRVVAEQIRPLVETAANETDLSFEDDVAFSTTRMPDSGVVVVRIQGAEKGRGFKKGMRSDVVGDNNTVFFADGPGDLGFATNLHDNGGRVLGTYGSPDQKDEIVTFLDRADARVWPADLPAVFDYATHKLTSNGRRIFI